MKMQRVAALGAATIGLALSGSTLVSPVAGAAAKGPSYHGCPYGAVCIYPRDKGYNNDHPDSRYIFFSYAGHNISGQYGIHRMVDNQYGGHYTGLCAKANGKGGFAKYDGTHYVGEGGTSRGPNAWNANLTPVNSVDLRPRSQQNSTCHR